MRVRLPGLFKGLGVVAGLLVAATGAAEPTVDDRSTAIIVSAGGLESFRELVIADAVNRSVNRLRAADDREIWRVEDFWATPRQMQEVGAGDCEDFALAKFAALIDRGVSPQRLWLTYARSLRPASGRIEMHMVVVLRTADGQQWVLDNLRPDIARLSRRRDLSLVRAVNMDGVWKLSGDGAPSRIAGPEGLPPRVSVMLRAIRDPAARMADTSIRTGGRRLY